MPAIGKVIAKNFLQIQLPGRGAPRSGLAANHHIDIGGNIFQADLGIHAVLLFNYFRKDYMGNVGVVKFNNSQTPFRVNISCDLKFMVI